MFCVSSYGIERQTSAVGFEMETNKYDLRPGAEELFARLEIQVLVVDVINHECCSLRQLREVPL